MESIVLEAPAKINLVLDIKGKRPDGYHELETVMHQINLVDRIHIKTNGEAGINLTTDHPGLTCGQENLAYRAAQLIFQESGCTTGIQVLIEKRIPLGAGLAGGSSDAAAVLSGINRLFELGYDITQLMGMAGCLGSDVPFCLLGIESAGATALARGRGEILQTLPHCILPWILIVNPGFELSTAEAYRYFSLDAVKTRPDLSAFLAAWNECAIIDIARQLSNVLETVSIPRCPLIEGIKQDMVARGALKALMSGSGPTVFGLYHEEAAARWAEQYFQSHYSQVHLVSSYSRGDYYAGK